MNDPSIHAHVDGHHNVVVQFVGSGNNVTVASHLPLPQYEARTARAIDGSDASLLSADAPILGQPESSKPRMSSIAPIVNDLYRTGRARATKFLAFERTVFSAAVFLLIITLIVPTAIGGLAGACLASVGFVFRWLHANELNSTNRWALFVKLYRNSNVSAAEEKQYNELVCKHLRREA